MSPHLSLDLVYDLEQLLAYQFMVNALLAGSIVAVSAGVAGWFMVLRRESFAGHALSVMAFPGAASALLAGVPASLGYFAFSAAGALAIGSATPIRRGRRDAQQSAAIGTVQAAALALGFLMLSLYGGVLESPTSLLFGSFLGVSEGQVLTLLALACGVLSFFALAGRPLLFASVDPSIASAHRVPVRALTLSFMLVLGLTVAATAQITGVLLIFALLVAPAATAAQITPRIGLGLLLSVAIALVTVWFGLGLSYFTNYAAGFFLTTIAFALYLAARLSRLLATRLGRRRGARDPRRSAAAELALKRGAGAG